MLPGIPGLGLHVKEVNLTVSSPEVEERAQQRDALTSTPSALAGIVRQADLILSTLSAEVPRATKHPLTNLTDIQAGNLRNAESEHLSRRPPSSERFIVLSSLLLRL
jgi:hypothetical protein